MRFSGLLVPVILALGATTGRGEDAYYDTTLTDLKITEGSLPAAGQPDWRLWQRVRMMAPYAVLDAEGEIYIETNSNLVSPADGGARIHARSAVGPATGTLFVLKPDFSGMVSLRFELPAPATAPEAGKVFLQAKEKYYRDLLSRGIPGGAWFRHQADRAGQARGSGEVLSSTAAPGWGRRRSGDDFADTYDLFTGGRALSENLALDRALRPAGAGEETVDIASLEGITVQAFDWKPLIAGKTPEKDPLASLVPADQYVLFFPSFEAMLALLDEADAGGTPVLQELEARAEDAGTRDRYQRQLCLDTSEFARQFGPHLVRSVAFTGSDPFLRTGTDVGILLDCPSSAAVLAYVRAKQAAAAAAPAPPHAKAELRRGEAGGVAWTAAVSPDDGVRSYAAAIGNVVVVTNSLHQLEALAAAATGTAPALAGLDEYAFFRDRYRRDDPGETALLIIPDAAIRKWCGPQWRIADSRRTRALALLSELQARRLDDIARGDAREGPAADALPAPEGDEFVTTPDGVRLKEAGSIRFLRPIAEAAPTRATKAEADSYRQWRTGYQENWRRWFDPIAVRFTVRPDRLGADVTILPLILGSDYGEYVRMTSGVAVAPDAGDRHPGVLVHGVHALNTKSEEMHRTAGFLGQMAPGLQVDPLGWIGGSVALYVEDGPFWDDLAKISDDRGREAFLEKQFGRLPVALHVEVGDPLKLTLFLAALRGFIDQTAPGMLDWETRTHLEQPYVRVGTSARARAENPGLPDVALHYAATGKALVVSFDESMIQRSIERMKARTAGQDTAGDATPWLGKSLGFRANRRAVGLLSALGRETYREAMQTRSWGNLPILNELHRRHPDRDLAALCEHLWGARPVCPGGGTYVWNERWRTMASTVYGCPAEPKPGPDLPAALEALDSGDFGLTFEHDGLRAVVDLRRRSAVK